MRLSRKSVLAATACLVIIVAISTNFSTLYYRLSSATWTLCHSRRGEQGRLGHVGQERSPFLEHQRRDSAEPLDSLRPLYHRSGMSWGDNLIIGIDNNILIREKDSMAYFNSQTRPLPFQGQFSYKNLAFELAGKVIESLSHLSYFDFVSSRILDLLSMNRTYLKTPPPSDLDNVEKY
ncbi:hypothetical protein EDB80DRAFT_843061 [Ilyonectria destructans]|nr:hypothetical protein EDB80DRAFT_843061 [Ilyonectria destructans]